MNHLPVILSALLYTAFICFANPTQAQMLTEEQRSELSALRQGEMRKLVIHSEPMPVSSETYTDAEGAGLSLRNSDGQVRLINFWATWCAPCRLEKPSLDVLNKELASPGFGIIAIATGRNSLEGIKKFNAEVGVETLETNLDPLGKLAASMRVPGLPVSVILNREGFEIARLMGGADWDTESARQIIRYLTELPG